MLFYIIYGCVTLYNHTELCMSRNLPLPALVVTLMGGTALADVPRVAVDIAPVYALVAQVMQGVGVPDLIVPPGASPHQYNLRPSEARALQEADLVFWVGEELTPWLADTVATLAGDASVTALMDTDGTVALQMREGALFEAHDHGDHGAHENGEDHADHGEHEHEAEHEHEHDAAEEHDAAHEHDHGHEEAHSDDADHGHAQGGTDAHAWLMPQNAKNWLGVIEGALSAADPDNADAYAANADAGRAEIDAAVADVRAMLDPLRGARFVVFHDAYQYFEVAFDFPASGAISLSDASDPSPARLAQIQGRIAEEGISCVLSEPQFSEGLVATVLEGTQAARGVLDPLGSDLAPGPDFYPKLIRNLGMTLADCL